MENIFKNIPYQVSLYILSNILYICLCKSLFMKCFPFNLFLFWAPSLLFSLLPITTGEAVQVGTCIAQHLHIHPVVFAAK